MSGHFVTVSIEATSPVELHCPQADGRWTLRLLNKVSGGWMTNIYITGTPDDLLDFARRLGDVAELLGIEAVSE